MTTAAAGPFKQPLGDLAGAPGVTKLAPEGALPPHSGDEPAFGAPWQAQAFAMVLQLHQGGLFSWPEWAQALAEQVRSARSGDDAADPGDVYYGQWLAALETLLAQKGVASAPALAELQQRWADAAAHTPHGQAIELR